jgi:hypothetical protein
MGSVAAQGLFVRRYAGAIDQAVNVAEGLCGECDRGLAICLIYYIGLMKENLFSQFRGKRFTISGIDVYAQDSGTFTRERGSRGSAEAGSSIGDQKAAILELHCRLQTPSPLRHGAMKLSGAR